ncbi:DUF1835 domain-containing protein [Foetidibacter luteolus]|uniref:DUF1835 domain-containing protein n=1 Tax=Foetidibacter luteolus TaxID=2608880 RepID=UPI00129A92EC|nr:DUF1835 domain-containing protein [Foetidibacter luteolus]
MLHIVFQEADIAVLQKAIELDEKGSMNGEVWQIKDDFAVGPIVNIYQAEGYQQRRDWWKGLLEFSPYTEQIDIVDDKLTVHNLLKKLDEEADLHLWIWMGQNQHDVCGYYWLMSQLKQYQGRIHVLYLNNLPFINEKGSIFYPTDLHQIQPKEFLKAKRLARVITLSEFEVDPDEWKRLCNENALIRTLEGGKKIAGCSADFYDKALLGAISGDFQKLGKVLQNAFSKMKIATGDVFLVWRIRQMQQDGKLEVQGDWAKGWKEISVKLARVAVAEHAEAVQ